MALKVRCPSCGALLSAPDSYHGKSIKCPKCNSRFTALTEEETQREKESLRLETEKRKQLQEKMATLQQEKPKERAKPTETGQGAAPVPRTINCPDCGGIVSKQASTCPHCGRPFREQKASITQVDPFAEFHTPIAGKKKGKITPIGWMGICLGVFLIAVSLLAFSRTEAEGTPVLMLLLGVFFLIGCYCWARATKKDE